MPSLEGISGPTAASAAAAAVGGIAGGAQQSSSSGTRRPGQGSQHKPTSSRLHNAPAAANTLADLTSCVRRTTGDVPPGLVGFSSTTIGDKLYIFGGRLVHVRRMVNELRALDLNTLVWEKLWPRGGSGDDVDGPQPRYFHSADAWGHKLVIFGGMGQSGELDDQNSKGRTVADNANESGPGPDPNLSVMADLLIFDTLTHKWESPKTSIREGIETPLARYAHLSAITNGCLIILGGQDILNRYIEQMCCLELETMTYVQKSDWQGHAGTYRSVAVSRHVSVDLGGTARRPGTRNGSDQNRMSMLTMESESTSAPQATSLIDETLQLPFSTMPSPEEPVYTFTNYNFADVRRALDMVSAPSSPNWTSTVTSLSDLMVGAPSLPPGLRFPTAAMIGSHLVLTGTLITQQVSSFAIWTLDLGKAVSSQDVEGRPKLVWQKVDAGHALRSGSWNRAVAWRNSVVILGDRDRDIAIDYNRRQNNFAHVVFVDLETFGIYQPPEQVLPFPTQEFGLSLLSQPLLADFDVVCTDGITLTCSRGVLEERWPWFRQELQSYMTRTNQSLREAFTKVELQEKVDRLDLNGGPNDLETTITNSKQAGATHSQPMPLVSPYRLILPETSQVGTAILQYFYTLNLITPLQHTIPVLVSLLLFGKNYDLTHLRALVAHAFHVRLSSGQASPAIVYEAAALGGCIALQTRALKMMMNATTKAKMRPAQTAPNGSNSRRSVDPDHRA